MPRTTKATTWPTEPWPSSALRSHDCAKRTWPGGVAARPKRRRPNAYSDAGAFTSHARLVIRRSRGSSLRERDLLRRRRDEPAQRRLSAGRVRTALLGGREKFDPNEVRYR